MPRRNYNRDRGRRRPQRPSLDWQWLAVELERRHYRHPDHTRPQEHTR